MATRAPGTRSLLRSAAQCSTRPALTRWVSGGTESYLLQVSWFAEQSLASEGKLTVMGTISSALDECPCEVDQLDIRYFLTPDPLVEYYAALEARMVVESFTVGEDGNLRADGNLDATLGYVAGPMVSLEPDPERTVRVTGTFEIDRLFTDFEP